MYLPCISQVQGIFDDDNPRTRQRWKYPDGKPYDADRNTRELRNALVSYAACTQCMHLTAYVSPMYLAGTPS